MWTGGTRNQTANLPIGERPRYILNHTSVCFQARIYIHFHESLTVCRHDTRTLFCHKITYQIKPVRLLQMFECWRSVVPPMSTVLLCTVHNAGAIQIEKVSVQLYYVEFILLAMCLFYVVLVLLQTCDLLL